MNKIVLLGRLVRNPELKVIDGVEKCCTRFTIAVDRRYKSEDGTTKVDFIPIIMWGKDAEVVAKYFKKGQLIGLCGRLRTGSYEDKEGNKKYIAEVIAEKFKFVNCKSYSNENDELEINEKPV